MLYIIQHRLYLVHGKSGVVRLDHCIWYFGWRDHGEGSHYSVRIFLSDLMDMQWGLALHWQSLWYCLTDATSPITFSRQKKAFCSMLFSIPAPPFLIISFLHYLRDEKCAHAWPCPPSQRVGQLEALQTIYSLSLLPTEFKFTFMAINKCRVNRCQYNHLMLTFASSVEITLSKDEKFKEEMWAQIILKISIFLLTWRHPGHHQWAQHPPYNDL